MTARRLHSRAPNDLEALVVGDPVFAVACGVVFVGAVAATIMLADPMHAGHASMMWMSGSGQAWLAAGAGFMRMWVVMMAAMMLPSLTPMLLRYRRAAAETGEIRIGTSTALLGLGYSLVWMVLGAVTYPFGAAVATVAHELPSVSYAGPLTVGVLVLIAGLLQLTEWNAHHIACCRELADARTPKRDRRTPWRQGLDLGVHCVCCSALPMAILLVSGGMSLITMSIVTAAMTLERVTINGARVARALGALVIPMGLILIARAIGQG